MNKEQRASRRAWARSRPDCGAYSPQADRVAEILRRASEPLAPGTILAALDPPTTPGALSVCLNRMQKAGRLNHLGYGQWELAE